MAHGHDAVTPTVSRATPSMRGIGHLPRLARFALDPRLRFAGFDLHGIAERAPVSGEPVGILKLLSKL